MEVTCEAKDLRVILTGIQSHVCRDGTRSFDSLIEVKRTDTAITFETTDGYRAFHRSIQQYGTIEGEDGKGYLYLNEVKAALALMPKAGPYTIEVHDTGATWPDLSRVAKLDGEGIRFNAKYLRDALNALKDSEYVTLELHQHSASVIRPAGEYGDPSATDYILVMPVYVPPSQRSQKPVEEPTNAG